MLTDLLEACRSDSEEKNVKCGRAKAKDTRLFDLLNWYIWWSHWLAVGGAVDAAGAEQVEAARWVEAAAALAAVTQAAVVALHQRLARSQHATLTKYAHGLAH